MARSGLRHNSIQFVFFPFSVSGSRSLPAKLPLHPQKAISNTFAEPICRWFYHTPALTRGSAHVSAC